MCNKLVSNVGLLTFDGQIESSQFTCLYITHLFWAHYQWTQGLVSYIFSTLSTPTTKCYGPRQAEKMAVGLRQFTARAGAGRAKGYAVDFLYLSLHAVSRDPEAYPSPCINTQVFLCFSFSNFLSAQKTNSALSSTSLIFMMILFVN
ncbi:hypothetical protein GQ457_15G001460 [Hibiscus cannabinus]